MCNLYLITTNQAAITALFRRMNRDDALRIVMRGEEGGQGGGVKHRSAFGMPAKRADLGLAPLANSLRFQRESSSVESNKGTVRARDDGRILS
jgi:hypothetical protein